jgi:benzodiazapine receptor
VAWSWLFFGLRNPGLGFVDIILLWIAIAATLVAFWRRSALAGLLFVPYLAWVTLAAVLNYSIWQLNA